MSPAYELAAPLAFLFGLPRVEPRLLDIAALAV